MVKGGQDWSKFVRGKVKSWRALGGRFGRKGWPKSGGLCERFCATVVALCGDSRSLSHAKTVAQNAYVLLEVERATCRTGGVARLRRPPRMEAPKMPGSPSDWADLGPPAAGGVLPPPGSPSDWADLGPPRTVFAHPQVNFSTFARFFTQKCSPAL